MVEVLSVISLSSSSGRASPPSEHSSSFVVSVSSDGQRVPVSWINGSCKSLNVLEPAESEKHAPNYQNKVRDWMKTCDFYKDKLESEQSETANKTTCIRYDFDKSAKKVTKLSRSFLTKSTPLFTYMAEAKKNSNYSVNGRNNGNIQDNEYYMDKTPASSIKQSGSVKNNKGDSANRSMLNSLLSGVSGVKRKKVGSVEGDSQLLPLPPKRFYEQIIDFDDCVVSFVNEVNSARKIVQKKTQVQNGPVKTVEKHRKFTFAVKKVPSFERRRLTKRGAKALRSKGHLRDISLDTLISRTSHPRTKVAPKRRVLPQFKRKPSEKPYSVTASTSTCEIVSVPATSDDDNIDLRNFVDDMLELEKMSEEHRKSVIETRTLASNAITNLINKQASKEENVQKAMKIFSNLSTETEKTTERDTGISLVNQTIVSEHDYANVQETEDNDNEEGEESEESLELNATPLKDLEIVPVKTNVERKSLRRSLEPQIRRKFYTNSIHNSDSKKINHSIIIAKKNGQVLRGFYQEYNLVIVQQNVVSFWTQSALGNILGAQNMWIPKGQAQRILLNQNYSQKDSMEMVITTETSLAYVELWTKEHKSEIRETPVADVFAIVYFWRLRQNGLDKKALQLENIKGSTEDVQYCVLRYYPRIIVSWYSIQGTERKTKIHAYHLATDFQTVANISEIQPVQHRVKSLHNIEDCDNMIMGSGDTKITLWNVEHGYIVATIELSIIESRMNTLWVKGDRGFLFVIQECGNKELRLIAINGMNRSWKTLQNYKPKPGPRFESLRGVHMESGVLIAYYSKGLLCWNAQSGQVQVEELYSDKCEMIHSGKDVIMIVNDEIIVRHSLSRLITADEF